MEEEREGWGPGRKGRHARKGATGAGWGQGPGVEEEVTEVHSGPLQTPATSLHQRPRGNTCQHPHHLLAPSLCQRNNIPKGQRPSQNRSVFVEGTPSHLRGNILLFSHVVQDSWQPWFKPCTAEPSQWGPVLWLQREKGGRGDPERAPSLTPTPETQTGGSPTPPAGTSCLSVCLFRAGHIPVPGIL